MDGIKWWFIMGQTHDGGFVPMPGRDYASTDHVYATRIMPSAIAALILYSLVVSLLITVRTALPFRPGTEAPPRASGRNSPGASPPLALDPHGADASAGSGGPP